MTALIPAIDSVQLISYHDPVTRTGSRSNRLRNAGEIWGHLIEEIVRCLIQKEFPLHQERLLVWKEEQADGKMITHCREMDAVVFLDNGSLIIFEVKLTSLKKMQNGAGRHQLHTASRILASTGRYPQVLKRLVYIGLPTMLSSSVWPPLSANDTCHKTGILWIPPAKIDATATSLGIPLPRQWHHARYRRTSIPWGYGASI